MAIRFEHQAGAGLIGAFAAGQAARSRRGQKYAMDMMMQNRRHQQVMQQRMAGAYGRYGLGRGRRGGGGAGGGGRLIDPLAADSPLALSDPVQHKAALQARGRKSRLGEPIPGQWQPQFTPQWKLDQEEADLEFEREQGVADLKRKRGLEGEAAERTREARTAGTAQDRKSIAEERYSPEDTKLIEESHRTIQSILQAKNINEEVREAALAEQYAKLDDLRSRITEPPTEEEQWETDTIVVGGNRVQRDKKSGEWKVITGFESPEEKAAERAEEQAAKAEEQAEKEAERVAKEAETLKADIEKAETKLAVLQKERRDAHKTLITNEKGDKFVNIESIDSQILPLKVQIRDLKKQQKAAATAAEPQRTVPTGVPGESEIVDPTQEQVDLGFRNRRARELKDPALMAEGIRQEGLRRERDKRPQGGQTLEEFEQGQADLERIESLLEKAEGGAKLTPEELLELQQAR